MPNLIINIPDDDYKILKATSCYRTNTLEEAVINGIVLPDNATNGDVIKALYLNDMFKIEQGLYINKARTMYFDIDWWNSPYNHGGEK